MSRTQGFWNEAAERRSWAEQQEVFGRELRDVVAHAHAHAPAVRAMFDKLGLEPGDIRGLGDLPKLPVTAKAALVELQRRAPPFGGLLAVPPTEIAHIFQSPGPIYDPVAKGEGWGYEEGLYAAGFRPGDVCINTFSYHMTPAGMMFHDDLTSVGCAVVPTGVGERETQVQIMRTLGAKGYLGMASFLVQIGEKARELGVDPRKDLSLEVAWSIAEPMPPSLRSQVEEMFGCVCRQGYGTADVGCIGYECYHLGGWHLTHRAIVEIVDPTTGTPLPDGETGEVVVTLFNRAYPLLRLGTGDLSALDPGSCACGRHSPKLRGWLGRADQLVKVKGMFLHPGQVQGVLREFPEVKRYRAVATRDGNRDQVTLYIDTGATPEPALVERLQQRLRDVLRIGVAVAAGDDSRFPADGLVLADERVWD
ncbi:MAG: AMP-binding protein [Deferrisomatales bacterium]|nr:AMP-binding protein [Deferrisomatales bacterium]